MPSGSSASIGHHQPNPSILIPPSKTEAGLRTKNPQNAQSEAKDLRSGKIATESLPLSREKSAEQTEPKANLRLRHKQADLPSGKIATESLPHCNSVLPEELGVGVSQENGAVFE